MVLAKYSLVGNVAGADVTRFEGNLIGNGMEPIDPLLGPLADNGGRTQTHDLLSGSPAFNAGDPNIPGPPEFDQRGVGFDRIQHGVIDIGETESTGFENNYTVDTLIDEIDGDYGRGNLSLREAIAVANAEPGNDLINFDASLRGGVIFLEATLGELLISDSMKIDAGDLPGGLTISAASTDATPNLKNGDGTRLLRIDDRDAATQRHVQIEGITLTGGDVTGNGGAITSREGLSLYDVSVLNNSATGNGGGVCLQDAMLQIENSTIADNSAGADGGGLWSHGTGRGRGRPHCQLDVFRQ